MVASGVVGVLILGALEIYKGGWDSFSPLLSFKVGDGSRVRIWHDGWCGGSPLKVVYPELFLISKNRDASVATLMFLHWDLNFLRNVQYWELYSMNLFLDSIYSATVEGHGDDNLC